MNRANEAVSAGDRPYELVALNRNGELTATASFVRLIVGSCRRDGAMNRTNEAAAWMDTPWPVGRRDNSDALGVAALTTRSTRVGVQRRESVSNPACLVCSVDCRELVKRCLCRPK